MTPDKARTFQTAHRNIDVPTVEERRRDTAHAEDLAGVLVKEATDHRRRSGRLRQSHRDVKRASTPSGSSRTCCTAASGFSNSPLLCRVSRSPTIPQRAGYPSSARCSRRIGPRLLPAPRSRVREHAWASAHLPRQSRGHATFDSFVQRDNQTPVPMRSDIRCHGY